MSLVYQGDAGLIQGIQQGGGALAQALGQATQARRKQSQFKKIGEMLKDQPIDTTLLSEIIQQPGGQEFLSGLGPYLTPQLKSQAAAATAQQIDDDFTSMPSQRTVLEETMFGEESPQAPDTQSQPQQAAPMSPIQSSQMESPTEFEAGEKTIVTPSGVYGEEEFIDTPYGKFHPRQISRYLSSGDRSLIEKGKLIDKYINDKEVEESKEGRQKRKEWREEIRDFSKPYQDITKLESGVKKLEKAKELILTGKTNRDTNWMRRAAQSVLEDSGALSKAELVKTPEDQILYSLIYDTLRTKDLGGSNPSTREVMLSLAAKPSPFKGMKANVAVIDDLIRQAKENEIKGKAISGIREKSGPMSFSRFQRELQDEVTPLLEQEEKSLKQDSQVVDAKISVRGKKPKAGFIWMMDDQGIARQVPSNRVQEAQQRGGVLLNGK